MVNLDICASAEKYDDNSERAEASSLVRRIHRALYRRLLQSCSRHFLRPDWTLVVE